jgi:hypothetical protein
MEVFGHLDLEHSKIVWDLGIRIWDFLVSFFPLANCVKFLVGLFNVEV